MRFYSLQLTDRLLFFKSNLETGSSYYAGWGKNRFIVVSTMQNTEFIIVLFSIQATVNLLLPQPVLMTGIVLNAYSWLTCCVVLRKPG